MVSNHVLELGVGAVIMVGAVMVVVVVVADP